MTQAITRTARSGRDFIPGYEAVLVAKPVKTALTGFRATAGLGSDNHIERCLVSALVEDALDRHSTASGLAAVAREVVEPAIAEPSDASELTPRTGSAFVPGYESVLLRSDIKERLRRLRRASDAHRLPAERQLVSALLWKGLSTLTPKQLIALLSSAVTKDLETRTSSTRCAT